LVFPFFFERSLRYHQDKLLFWGERKKTTKAVQTKTLIKLSKLTRWETQRENPSSAQKKERKKGKSLLPCIFVFLILEERSNRDRDFSFRS